MTLRRIAVVSGGAGFIGSHMVDLLLERGFQVRVIDDLSTGREQNLAHQRSNSDLFLDTRDIRQILPGDPIYKGAEFFFHFAGRGDIIPSVEDPAGYLSVNVMGTVHALEAVRYNGTRKFLYAASSSCYGLATELPTTEEAQISPQYPYALSKYLGEQAVMHWERVYHLPVVSLRIFNVYGPRSRTTGAYGAVFGVFIAQKLAGKPFTVVGDGTQTRDFVFVTDVVRAFMMAAESPNQGQIYNLGSGVPQEVNRLVDLLGGGQVVHVPKRPGEPDCTWADIRKIRCQLGWYPAVSFEEGVAAITHDMEYWREAPVWDADSIRDATRTWFALLSRESA